MSKKVKTKVRAKVSSKISGKTAKRSDLVRKYLKEAKDSVETGYIRICRFVNEAYKKDYYKDWNFASFEVYCNTELNMEYRKAMVFVRIADKITELDIPDARAEVIGWAKINQIIKIATPKNRDEWLKEAEKSSLIDLTKSVSIRKDTAGISIPKITTMKFKMGEDVASIITDALSEAKVLQDSDDSVQALQMICMDWLEQKGKVPQHTTKKAMQAYIDKVYGDKKPTNTESKSEEPASVPPQISGGKNKKSKKEKTGEKEKPVENSEEGQNIDDILGL